MSMPGIKSIADWMQQNKFGEYTSPVQEKIFVFWQPIQKVADAIHQWADRTGRMGSVETVMDLIDDSSNKNELFYGMPVELVIKACEALQDVGKAQVFGSGEPDNVGVKFFNM